jgi:hypothetical protein
MTDVTPPGRHRGPGDVAPVGEFAYRPPKKPWYKRRWVHVVAAVIALLVVGALVAS